MNINLFSNVVCDMFVVYAMHIVLMKYYSKKANFLNWLVVGVYIVADTIIYAVNDNSTIFVISSLILYFLFTLGYNIKVRVSNFVFAVVFLSMGICTELLGLYISSFAYKKIDSSTNINLIVSSLIISRILFLIFLYVVSEILAKNKKTEIPNKNIVSTLLIPVLSIFLVIYVFSVEPFDQYSIENVGNVGAMVAIICLMLIDIISCWIFDRQHALYNLSLEKKNLELTVEMQQRLYENELGIRERIAKMNHDNKNMLIGLETEIKEGHIDSALYTIDNIICTNYSNSIVKSGHYAIDAVIGYKASRASEYGISIKPSFKLEKMPSIENVDISVLLGNSLDNAIEYLKDHQNCRRVVEVDVVYSKGVLDFRIQNELEEEINITKESNIYSSKEGDFHGYGIKSMRYIAEKYDGNLVLSSSNMMFTCEAILYC